MHVSGDYTVTGIAERFSHYLPHPLADRTGSVDYYTIDFTWGWYPSPAAAYPRNL